MIHPSAIVHRSARLAPDVEVGPYSVIGEHVEVGAGSFIGSHVVLDGHTRIGRKNTIWHFVSIGAPPQDKKYQGEPTGVEIGDRNTFREFCTINRGTVQDAGVTRIGNDNWIMAYVHFAHDCEVGNKTIFANCTQLAGHVIVEDWVIFGATTLVHQYVRIGAHAFTGMGSFISQDVPPYVMAAGHMAKPYGINSEGLKRRGFTPQTIQALKRAYRTLYKSGLTLAEARTEIERQEGSAPEVRALLDFLATSTRGIVR